MRDLKCIFLKKTPIFVCQNSENCSVLCFLAIWSQKWRDLSFQSFVRKRSFLHLLRGATLKIYIFTCDVSLWDTCIAIWISILTLLYICGKDEKDKICTFFSKFITMIEKTKIFTNLNHAHLFIFQEVLHILVFKIIHFQKI